MIDLKNIEFYKNSNDNWKEEIINGRKFVFPIDWDLSNYENNIEMLKDTKKFKINSIDVLKEGFFPIVGQESKDNQGFQNDNTKTIKEHYIVFGDHTTNFKLLKKPFSIANDGIQVFKTKENMNLTLLFYISKERIIKSTGYNRHFKTLKEKYFINPSSLEEQEKIASILETQENLIDSKKELLKKYKKQRKYFQQELLSGRIRMKLNNKSMAEAFELGLIKQTFLNDANEVVEYGGDTITNVNIDIIDKDCFENWLSIDFENKIEFYKNIDFKEEKINGTKILIPMNWKIDTLNNISNFRRGAFPQPYGLEQWYDDINGKPFIQVCDVQNDKIKNITKKRISLKAEPFSLKVLPGTIVLTIQGTIGKIAIIEKESFVDRTLLIFQNINENINKNYFFKNIKALFEIEEKKAEGGVIKSINKEKLSKFIVKLPNNLMEQTLIAEQLTKIDNLIESLEEEIKLEDKKFTYLKQELLSGRIRVN